MFYDHKSQKQKPVVSSQQTHLPTIPAAELTPNREPKQKKRKHDSTTKPRQTMKIHTPRKSNKSTTPIDQTQTTLIPPPEQVLNAYHEAVQN